MEVMGIASLNAILRVGDRRAFVGAVERSDTHRRHAEELAAGSAPLVYRRGTKTGGLSLRSEQIATSSLQSSRGRLQIARIKKSAPEGAFFMVADEHLISTLRFNAANSCR